MVPTAVAQDLHFKDAVLDQLAQRANVAQFVSFDPTLAQRYSRVRGYAANHRFDSVEDAIRSMLAVAPEGRINIRSFDPEDPKSKPFHYGLDSVEEILSLLQARAADGLHTILNETVDINDGGVSGVAFGDVMEFAPGDTPRCVEKPGTCALPREVAIEMLQLIYGFDIEIPGFFDTRVEFSIHPIRRGYENAHVIVWEIEDDQENAPESVEIRWPNRFSQLIGDKTFGIMIADLAGALVPATVAIPRGVAPFSFGSYTGCDEPWIRTAPAVQTPGKFTTQRGYTDPYRLMANEDPEGNLIAAVLIQNGVDAMYSGAAVADADGALRIEGVSGYGDAFMGGQRAPEDVPADVMNEVRQVHRDLFDRLGTVRFEWVFDQMGRLWVVQLHRGASQMQGNVIVPGEASSWLEFDVSEGLESLRSLVVEAQSNGSGILIKGRVGVTSHFGDVLRKAGVPSRVDSAE